MGSGLRFGGFCVTDKGELLAQPGFRETRHELLAAIVVVDARGEPKATQVGLEGFKLLAFLLHLIGGVDGLEHVAEAQVVASVLVEEDVAAQECGLLKVINEGFLLERELLKALHLVAQHLNVVKLDVGVAEGVMFVLCQCICGRTAS